MNNATMTGNAGVVQGIMVDGREHADRLNIMAWKLRGSDPKRSYALAEEAFRCATQLPYQRGTAYSLRTLGYGRMVFFSDYETALVQLRESSSIFEMRT